MLNHERLAMKASVRFINRHATDTGDPEHDLALQAYQVAVEEIAPPKW